MNRLEKFLLNLDGKFYAKSIATIVEMSLKRERCLPIFLAITAGVVSGTGFIHWDYLSSPSTIAVSTIAIGLIVAGFADTQRSLLLSMMNSEVIRKLANSEYSKDILYYFSQCIFAGLFTTSISFVGIFLGNSNVCSQTWCKICQQIWWGFWVSSIVLMISILFRNQRIMHKILNRFMEEHKISKK